MRYLAREVSDPVTGENKEPVSGLTAGETSQQLLEVWIAGGRMSLSFTTTTVWTTGRSIPGSDLYGYDEGFGVLGGYPEEFEAAALWDQWVVQGVDERCKNVGSKRVCRVQGLDRII